MKEVVPCLPRVSQIPGPRGATGATGNAGSNGSNGVTPTTTTTSPFTMPASAAEVTITVGSTSWMAIGMPLFIETAGNFTVVTVISATTVRVQAQTATGNAAAGTTIASGKKVVTGAVMTPDSTVTNGLNARITSLESTPQGNRSWYSTTAPSAITNVLRTGDIWFDTDDGYKMYRWDGTAWGPVNKVLELPDFGTGIRPIVKVNSLPTSGYSDGDFVWLQTDGKLYRRTGGQWTKAVATGDLVGQIDGQTMIVDGTIITQKLGANSVTADKVGANQVITLSANVGVGVINNQHISTLSAGKISAGDIQTVNIGYAGRIFHPSAYDLVGTACTATATVAGGKLTAVAVTAGGSGYASAPAVTISGGGGTGAAASAVVVDGVVTAIVVTDPGSGYTTTPTVTVGRQVAYRYFRSTDFGTSFADNFTFAAGNGFTFTQPTPVTAYGPGNASWDVTGAVPTMCPDSGGKLLVQLQGRLIGHQGNILLYCKVNGGAAQPLASAYSEAGSTGSKRAVIDATRKITGLTHTSRVEFFVAPANANGDVETNVICRYEIDVTFLNW